MIFSGFIKTLLGLEDPEIPYRIPNHIVPEVIQWCRNNNVMDGIILTPRKDDFWFASHILTRMCFVFNSDNDKINAAFKDFLNENKFKFWRKRRKYEYCWAWKKADHHRVQLHFKAQGDILNAIEDFIETVEKLNYLLGPENWSTGDMSCISNFEIFGLYNFSYIDDAFFFNKKDLMLYKIIQ